MQKVLVLGASQNPARFSYKVVKRLRSKDMEVSAIGNRPGKIGDVQIADSPVNNEQIHTVLIYLKKENQESYYSYIHNLQPRQVIFNPGTENPVFEQQLKEAGIQVIVDCALVLIDTTKLNIT